MYHVQRYLRFAKRATFTLLPGAVERVKKIRDYAFVHFSHREDAVEAMKALNGKVMKDKEKLCTDSTKVCCRGFIQENRPTSPSHSGFLDL